MTNAELQKENGRLRNKLANYEEVPTADDSLIGKIEEIEKKAIAKISKATKECEEKTGRPLYSPKRKVFLTAFSRMYSLKGTLAKNLQVIGNEARTVSFRSSIDFTEWAKSELLRGYRRRL